MTQDSWGLVRPETRGDQAAIDVVHSAGFPTSAEADLVLRMSGPERAGLLVSLVATTPTGAIVGHVAFSAGSFAPIGADAPPRVAGLGPVAVLPAYRKRGIAEALIKEGLERCRRLGVALVVVLGAPDYYGRFGFLRASSLGITGDYGDGPAFQALSLQSNVEPARGHFHYHPAFDALEPELEPTRPLLFVVYAVSRDGALGRRGGVPWDYPEDRLHFDRTTRGHAVIMGRRTWEETGRPLEDRLNIVLSKSAVFPGAERAASLDSAVSLARAAGRLPFVIGGAGLFRAAAPLATTLYTTDIPETVSDADVYLPAELAAKGDGAILGFERVSSWMGSSGERYGVWRAARARLESTD
ncbi:MAG: dihydrofolate reductase [Polyangiaceae bacterium]